MASNLSIMTTEKQITNEASKQVKSEFDEDSGRELREGRKWTH